MWKEPKAIKQIPKWKIHGDAFKFYEWFDTEIVNANIYDILKAIVMEFAIILYNLYDDASTYSLNFYFLHLEILLVMRAWIFVFFFHDR